MKKINVYMTYLFLMKNIIILTSCTYTEHKLQVIKAFKVEKDLMYTKMTDVLKIFK